MLPKDDAAVSPGRHGATVGRRPVSGRNSSLSTTLFREVGCQLRWAISSPACERSGNLHGGGFPLQLLDLCRRWDGTILRFVTFGLAMKRHDLKSMALLMRPNM